jgi:alpha-L-fucosidase
LGTVTGREWTQGIHSPDSFKVSGINTDQWCKVATEAGMGYIIIVSKHHDGFCLWDTKTTSFKATNSPLKKDALAELRKSCDKYGIKMCLYFSEGDWTWSEKKNAKMKEQQLTELFTQYGEIALIWMDVAQGDGGLGHQETVDLIRKYQPNCFIGFNHGLQTGDLQTREMGSFDRLKKCDERPFTKKEMDSLTAMNDKLVLEGKWAKAAEIEKLLTDNYAGYKLAECAVCINQADDRWYKRKITENCPEVLVNYDDGLWFWFYHKENENVAITADQILEMYNRAVASQMLFSLAMGPNKNGELRQVDVDRLREVGEKLGIKN